jgi:hypothetical protein
MHLIPLLSNVSSFFLSLYKLLIPHPAYFCLVVNNAFGLYIVVSLQIFLKFFLGHNVLIKCYMEIFLSYIFLKSNEVPK